MPERQTIHEMTRTARKKSLFGQTPGFQDSQSVVTAALESQRLIVSDKFLIEETYTYGQQ